MKSERRRNARVPVQIPVMMTSPNLGGSMKVTTVDVSEGGMAVTLPKGRKPTGRWHISFTLPGTEDGVDLSAEFAWEGSSEQAGLRFLEAAPKATLKLREWLQQNSPDAEQDDPPIRCQLSDLSLGGCYLEIPSPFPVSTRVTLSMRAGGVEVRAHGVVRVMHPDKGMGVEFVQATAEHRSAVEKFLGVLTQNRSLLPELLVQPDGLEAEAPRTSPSAENSDDPLLQLFYGAALATDDFHEALRKQRAIPASMVSRAAAGAQA